MSQQQGQSGKRGILSSSGESLDTAVDAGDARGPFVGRGPEITALRDAATLAIDGRGGLVLLVGEPGIGKTRLAEELAVDASARGLCVLWGRCWEGAGTQAFWPWIQVIRSYIHEHDISDLLTRLRGQVADISRIVPDLQPEDVQRHVPISAEPEGIEERFRVFESVAALLRHAASRQPLLVVIDDLQWADRPSLVFLEFLAGELARSPILLIATYRDAPVVPEQPLRQTLGELTRHGSSRRVVLQPLDRLAVASFVGAVSKFTPDSALIDVLYERSEGNPFFLVELVRLFKTEDGDRDELRRALASRVPQSVFHVVAQRLNHLSAETKLVLSVAAVVGREFDLNVIERVSGVRIAQLFDCLDEAITARVIGEVPEFIGRYRFLHVLLQETLCAEGTIRRRVELHRSIGIILEQVHASQLESYAAKLAHHYFECSTIEGVGKALKYAILAGRSASQALAYEEAVAQFKRALTLLDLEPTTERERCELLVALGDALNQVGAWEEARGVFGKATRLARRICAPDLLAQAAIGHKGLSWSTSPVDPACVALLEEALAALPSSASVLRVLVLRALAMLSYFAPGPRRQLFSAQAMSLADELDDYAARGYALEARLVEGWKPSNLNGTLATATEIVHVADRSGQSDLAFQGHLVRYASLLELGDRHGAEFEAAQCASIAEELRHPKYVWQMAVVSCGRALLHGNLSQAERLIREVYQLGRRLPGEMASHYMNLHTCLLARAQGQLGELGDTIASLARQHSDLAIYRIGLAMVHVAKGNKEEAGGLASRLIDEEFPNLGDNVFHLLGIAYLAEVCALIGDEGHGEILYGRALRYADHNVVVSWGAACDGSFSHYLGVLATSLGRWQAAEGHFDRALEMNTTLQAPLLIARTRIAQVEMLIRRDEPDDHNKASEYLREVVATYERLDVKAQLMAAALRFGEYLQVQRKKAASSTRSVVRKPFLDSVALGDSHDVDRGDAPRYVFCREGEYWTLIFDGKLNRLRSTRGLEYLAYLVARPNRPIHALDLTAAVGSKLRSAESNTELGHQLLAESGSQQSRLQDLGSVIDARALREYRGHLRDLKEDLQEAERHNDTVRVGKLRDEIQRLTSHLAAASRRDGGARVAGSYSERARISVKNNITSAIKTIGQHDAALARHLSNALRTGTFCSYVPEGTVTWKV